MTLIKTFFTYSRSGTPTNSNSQRFSCRTSSIGMGAPLYFIPSCETSSGSTGSSEPTLPKKTTVAIDTLVEGVQITMGG